MERGHTYSLDDDGAYWTAESNQHVKFPLDYDEHADFFEVIWVFGFFGFHLGRFSFFSTKIFLRQRTLVTTRERSGRWQQIYRFFWVYLFYFADLFW